MATIVKYLLQYLVLPLGERLIDYFVRRAKTISDAKARKEANRKKVTAYEQSAIESASTEFGKLP